MRALLYLLFLVCLVPFLFFAGLVRRTKSLALISRAWARLSPVPAVICRERPIRFAQESAPSEGKGLCGGLNRFRRGCLERSAGGRHGLGLTTPPIEKG